MVKSHIKTDIPVTTLTGVAWLIRAVVVLELERAFAVGGEVVAATRALAGRGRSLNQNTTSVAIDQGTGPAGGCCQPEGAAEPLGELELELIHTHMAQKPLLWVKVGVHAVRKRLECGGVGWAGAGVAWRLCVCVVFEATWAVWRRQILLCGAPPQGVVCKAPLISGWVV